MFVCVHRFSIRMSVCCVFILPRVQKRTNGKSYKIHIEQIRGAGVAGGLGGFLRMQRKRFEIQIHKTATLSTRACVCCVGQKYV